MSNKWKYPTLEQCKRLVELGVVLKTEKVWVNPLNGTPSIFQRTIKNEVAFDKPFNECIPAPDVAELGAVLLCHHYQADWCGGNTFIRSTRNHLIEHAIKKNPKAVNEAQARAAALIWLIENRHIKPKDIEL